MSLPDRAETLFLHRDRSLLSPEQKLEQKDGIVLQAIWFTLII